ncbi:MAG: hypothetical protein M3142_07315 [Bacteroidota bacterium]|nr:hypothetical protein [Bacteroidota bacterium]
MEKQKAKVPDIPANRLPRTNEACWPRGKLVTDPPYQYQQMEICKGSKEKPSKNFYSDYQSKVIELSKADYYW